MGDAPDLSAVIEQGIQSAKMLRGPTAESLADLTLHQPDLLVRRAGYDGAELAEIEIEALALFAFAFYWGRLVRPTGTAAGSMTSTQLVGLVVGGREAGTGFESCQSPGRRPRAEWQAHVQRERALYAGHAVHLLERLRRCGRPESDQGELLVAAARHIAFLFNLACGESRNDFAGRAIMEHWEAGLSQSAAQSGKGGPGNFCWALLWKRVIPMLRDELASPRTAASRPGHAVAELAALRTFYRAARVDAQAEQASLTT